jgi:polyferredoxin
MTLGKLREKTLYGLWKARRTPHRYTLWRWVLGLVFTSLVLALPLSGLFHFDLWNGRHTVAGKFVSFPEAAKRFAFPFLALNIAILLATRFLGRYLCGFACPVGNLARLFEWARTRREQLRRARVVCALVCLLLSYAVLAFWVDARVLWRGDAAWRCGAWTFLLVTTLGLYELSRRVGLSFCQRWCPSGIYFAVLAHEGPTGIELAHPRACTECGVCDRVCPMNLQPRALASSTPSQDRGWYGDTFSNSALCIRCGDCVAACEGVQAKTSRGDDALVPLRMGFLQRVEPEQPAAACSEAEPTVEARDRAVEPQATATRPLQESA